MGQSISRSNGQDHSQQYIRPTTSSNESVGESPNPSTHCYGAGGDNAQTGSHAARLPIDNNQGSTLTGKSQQETPARAGLPIRQEGQDSYFHRQQEPDSVHGLDNPSTLLTPQVASSELNTGTSNCLSDSHSHSSSSLSTTIPATFRAATTSSEQHVSTTSPSAATRPTPAQIRSRRQRLAEGFLNMRRRSSQRLSWAFSGGSRPSTPTPSSHADCSVSSAANIDTGTPAPTSHEMVTDNTTSLHRANSVAAPATIETAPRDPYRIMTPPPEDDMMFEERQRARRIIEEALEQLQTDLTRSRSSNANPAITSPNSMSADINALPTGGHLPGISPEALSASTSALRPASANMTDMLTDSMQLDAPEARSTSLGTDPFARIYAPLPRRSSSRSPTPSSNVPPTLATSSLLNSTAAVNSPASSAGLLAPSQAARPSAMSPGTSGADGSVATADAMVPRRILVQGIVASSPPPTPTIGLPQPSAASLHSRNFAASHSDSESTSSNGLWAELPGSEAIQPERSQEARASSSSSSSQGSQDRVWEDAMTEVLAHVPDTRRPTPRQRASDSERNLQEQANLIGRLLSVAAAATAATLVPGITVNGAPVAGFGESQGLDALTGSGIPLASTSTSASVNDRSSPPQATPRPRSDSFGTFRTPRNAVQRGPPSVSAPSGTATQPTPSSPAALQEILRNALAAAFRSANPGITRNNVANASPSAASSLLDAQTAASQDMSSSTSNPLLPGEISSSSAPPPPSAAVPPPTRTQPSRSYSDPFGRGTALAIPFANLHSEAPYVSGSNHAPGSFERFLADLQSDVSSAIIRSREGDNAAVTTSDAEASQELDASGLEEMRPLLDDIEEVAADVPEAEATSAPDEEAPTDANGSAGLSSQQARQAQQFSFFRSYRFPPVSASDVADTASPASRTPDSTASSQAPSLQSQTPSFDAPSTSPLVILPLHAAPPASDNNREDTVMEGTSAAALREAIQGQEDLPAGQTLSRPTAVGAAETLMPTTQNPSAAPATNGSPAGTASRQMVPMLLVGVRSASLQVGGSGQGSISTSQPSTSDNTQGSVPSSTGEGLYSDGPTISSTSPDAPPAPGARSTQGFVLWILGGLYPVNHPIVIAPSLLGDDVMSYDELLRLAEVLGNVKPPTVTAEEIKKSTLKIVKTAAIPELLAQGEIRDITAERCLVCLEDYEEDEDIRILNCRHCFHQPCVDTWLSTGANTCPACRTVGVEKVSEPSSETLQV